MNTPVRPGEVSSPILVLVNIAILYSVKLQRGRRARHKQCFPLDACLCFHTSCDAEPCGVPKVLDPPRETP